MEQLDGLNQRLGQLNQRIEAQTTPQQALIERLDAISGVGKHTAQIMLAEVGSSVAQSPTDKQLASWACMSPGNHVSGGKRRSGKTRQGQKWLRTALIEAAWAASRSKDTYLGTQFHRLRAIRGAKRAAVAVGHSILTIAYHLIADPQATFQDLGGDYFIKRNQGDQKRRAVKTLNTIGYEVHLTPIAG